MQANGWKQNMARSRAGRWRKLRLTVDADSGMIVAQTLTNQQSDDASQVGPRFCRDSTVMYAVFQR